MRTVVEPQQAIHCTRCGSTLVWPVALSDVEKAEIAQSARPHPIHAITSIKTRLNLTLTQAKALSLHISQARGQCHRCGTSLGGAEAICTKCNSANLNW
jgi:uncharacterized OB-fold protein